MHALCVERHTVACIVCVECHTVACIVCVEHHTVACIVCVECHTVACIACVECHTVACIVCGGASHSVCLELTHTHLCYADTVHFMPLLCRYLNEEWYCKKDSEDVDHFHGFLLSTLR